MASSTMALARAFTRRTKHKAGEPSLLAREGHVKYPVGTIRRSQISLPTELISTTNVDALNAPDIRSISKSSNSSNESINSNFSQIDRSFLSTPKTAPDNSSLESSSPITPISDDVDLAAYFDSTPKRSATSAAQRTSITAPSLEAPAVPKRALSHSKKAHVALSRSRSGQRMSPPPNSLTQARPTETAVQNSRSAELFDPAFSLSEPGHPFGKELAQVNEVAEEFGLARRVMDDEEREMLEKGLCKFGVNDYLDEIAGISGGVFEDQLGPMARPWI